MSEPNESPIDDGPAGDEVAGSGSSEPRTWLAVLLSVLFQGAGHAYAGRPGQGVALWLGGLALIWGGLFLGLAKTFAGLLLLLAALVGYAVFVILSAARTARAARGTALGDRRWIAMGALIACPLLVGFLPLRAWLPVRSFKIPSGSMEPTMQVGDRLMADMRAWNRREPERGDLVVHGSPERPELYFLRRVVGLPGERIEIRDKQVFVDGEPIEEPWAVHRDSRTYPSSSFLPPQLSARDQFGPQTVPEGTLFLLGDNRDNSNDSRFLGPVDRSLLVGRPLYVYWSPERGRIGRSLRPAEP